MFAAPLIIPPCIIINYYHQVRSVVTVNHRMAEKSGVNILPTEVTIIITIRINMINLIWSTSIVIIIRWPSVWQTRGWGRCLRWCSASRKAPSITVWCQVSHPVIFMVFKVHSSIALMMERGDFNLPSWCVLWVWQCWCHFCLLLKCYIIMYIHLIFFRAVYLGKK